MSCLHAFILCLRLLYSLADGSNLRANRQVLPVLFNLPRIKTILLIFGFNRYIVYAMCIYTSLKTDN